MTVSSLNADPHWASTREILDNNRSKKLFLCDSSGKPTSAVYPKGVRSEALRKRNSRSMRATMNTRARSSAPIASSRQWRTIMPAPGEDSNAWMMTTTGAPAVLASARAALQKLPVTASEAKSTKTWPPTSVAAASAASILPLPGGPASSTAVRSEDREKSCNALASNEDGSTTASRNTAFAASRPTRSARGVAARGSRTPLSEVFLDTSTATLGHSSVCARSNSKANSRSTPACSRMAAGRPLRASPSAL
mmetsp:Transcript_77341/g.199085  ORF Transcript_77341/g.199085 Transcript_77341/m.199085 type:complete len:251 (+) Transcript_77341:473-1225(+)